MKRIVLTACILLMPAMASSLSGASETVPSGGEIELIKDQIESQIERIKRAREEAEAKMTLARLRVAEQLRMSEENLALQVEKLNRFEETLRDQITEDAAAMARAKQQRIKMMKAIAADVRSQINGASELMKRMRRIRKQVDAGIDDSVKQTSTDPAVNCSQTAQSGECKNMSQAADPASQPQAENPSPSPEPEASPQPSQPAPVAQKPT